MSASGQRAAAQIQAKLQQAVGLHQSGQLAQAEALYLQILKAQPQHFDALYLLGMLAAQSNRHAKAAEWFGKAVKLNGSIPDIHYSLGIALVETGRHEAAIASFETAIALKPDHADAYNELGGALAGLARHEDAVRHYDQAVAIDPGFAEAHNNRGNALRALKRHEAAIQSYDRAIALKPDFAGAHNNRGAALQDLGDTAGAMASYDKALSVNSSYAEAYYNRGVALQSLKRHGEAISNYDKAISLNAGYAEAYNNRGDAFRELRQYEAAVQSHEQAIAAKPDYAPAYNNLGNALKNLNQNEAALASYAKAIAIKPDYAEAFNNQGAVLQDMKQHQAALASYDKAIALKPDYAEAHFNRGIVLQAMERNQDALASYGTALSINPDYEFLFGTLLHARMQICDWAGAEANFALLSEKISRNEKACPSFPVLSMTSSPPIQRKAAEIWTAAKCPTDHSLPLPARRGRRDRIRIGYFSDDFRSHPVSLLTAELFETHDRARFEVFAFSTGPDTQDDMRRRLEGAFDRFIDVRGKSDREVVQLARSLEIDIAIDLSGYTGDARTAIFALRAAPVQVSYIGYLGTMGAGHVDYLIADEVLIPAHSREHYSEKIAYIPSYQANDSKREISGRIFSRQELGLPEAGFVYCCFNNSYKITPGTFDSWMRILKAVEGSVLFLYAGSELVQSNLRREAAARGVDAQRLVFSGRLPLPEHLARYRAADLFLDTLPYNAGATASDALWAGLPVLTCTADAFASRVAASLLTAIELPELITATASEYESAAIALAERPAYLQDIRGRLAASRATTLLFDTARFTQHLELAYLQMYDRDQAGLPPDHIFITPATSRHPK